MISKFYHIIMKINSNVIFVGDESVGKFTLLAQYEHTKRPESEYLVTYNESTMFSEVVKIDKISVFMNLMLANPSQSYDKLRPYMYKNANVIVICFSLVSKSSFRNVKKKWIREIKKYCPGVPYILVGMKSDLREKSEESISKTEGEKLKDYIHSEDYIECSARDISTIYKVYESAARVSLDKYNSKKENVKNANPCLIF